MQPYETVVVKDDYYTFTTAAGTKYACYFLSYASLFSEFPEIADYMFGINVEVIEGSSKGMATDERIGATVLALVVNFLSGLKHSVVYVCDSSDGREVLRKRKFDQWFKQYDDGTVIKIDDHIAVEDLNIYNAILIHKDNPKKNVFIASFKQLNETSREK